MPLGNIENKFKYSTFFYEVVKAILMTVSSSQLSKIHESHIFIHSCRVEHLRAMLRRINTTSSVRGNDCERDKSRAANCRVDT